MKRAIVLTLALVFFVAALVYFNVKTFGPTQSQEKQAYNKQDLQKASLKDPYADSDGDGLLNWEEDLYGTSKIHADSDGDGIPDGEEVAQGSDPTLYGEAEITVKVVKEDTDVYEFEQTANPPSIVSVMEQVGSLELVGLKQEQQNQKTPTQALSPAKQALKNCVNQTASVVQNSLVTSAHDAAVINSILLGQTNNKAPIQALLLANQRAGSLLTPLADNNCALLNPYRVDLQQAYALLTQALELIVKTDNSEQDDYQAWQAYAEAVAIWGGEIARIAEEVQKHKLGFGASEPGYLFVEQP